MIKLQVCYLFFDMPGNECIGIGYMDIGEMFTLYNIPCGFN